MIKLSIQSNIEKIRAKYGRLPNALRAALKIGNAEAADRVAEVMAEEAPRASGNLIRSITVKAVSATTIEVGPTADYAAAVIDGRAGGNPPPPLSSTRFRRWLSSKGIPKKRWWAVAISIGRKGIKKNPFEQRAFRSIRKEVSSIVNNRLRAALKVWNDGQ